MSGHEGRDPRVAEHREAMRLAHEREEAWHDEQEQRDPDYWKA